jgi:hypothetical protein
VSDIADEVNLWLCPRRGWCLRVPERVPDSALYVMVAYALTMYEKQHAEMPDGLSKRRLGKAIPDLIKLRVTQIVTKQPACARD